MKNKQLVENILKHVGGTANIATAAHCMTRLRLNLKDTSLAVSYTHLDVYKRQTIPWWMPRTTIAE